ncbi:MAG: endonuclease/exonuclease/phosphatase family protein [Phycisphaerales bacterium]|nr:endonuclease/exonuclease/phosphatase family protein [Phycisphaerales bacterium]
MRVIDDGVRGRLGRLVWALALAGLSLGYVAFAFARLYRADPADGFGRAEAALTWLSLMATTFLPHAGIALAFGLGLLLVMRRWRTAAAGVPLLAVSLGPWLAAGVLPRGGGFVPDADDRADGSMLVLSVNLLSTSGADRTILAQVERHRPDVILVQEITAAAYERMRGALAGEYAHAVGAPREDHFGQAVFSRVPFTRAARLYPPRPRWDLPQVMAFVDLAGREVCLWNVHLLPPVSFDAVAWQATRGAELGAVAAATGVPTLVCGDFNSPWVGQPLDSLRRGGYVEAHRVAGRGVGNTWPRRGVLRFAPGVRIDHVAVPPELECVGAWTGGDTGSDHRPVFARVRWRE